MSKTKKEEIKMEANKEVNPIDAALEQRVAKDIQEILETNGYGLQPFLQYSQFGILPSVKLVKTPKEDVKEPIETKE